MRSQTRGSRTDSHGPARAADSRFVYSCLRLGAVDALTGNATPWNPRPRFLNPDLGGYGSVGTLQLDNGALYAGGAFLDISDLPYSYLAGMNTTMVAGIEPGNPGAIALAPAFPNPVRGRAVIPFSLPRAMSVTAVVHDVAGREVRVLARDRAFTVGEHTLEFDGRGLAPGVYLCRVRATGFESTIRMALVR
jgi:hypothetical protein